MEGLSFKFDEYYVEECSKDVALKLREQAGEVISLLPEGVTFEEVPDPKLYSDPLGTTEQNDHSSGTTNQECPVFVSSADDDEEGHVSVGGSEKHPPDDGMLFLIYIYIPFVLFFAYLCIHVFLCRYRLSWC